MVVLVSDDVLVYEIYGLELKAPHFSLPLFFFTIVITFFNVLFLGLNLHLVALSLLLLNPYAPEINKVILGTDLAQFLQCLLFTQEMVACYQIRSPDSEFE
jgi:hypothetical protein